MKNHSHAITALILVACFAPWLSSSCSRGSSADHPPPVTVEKAPDPTLVEVPDPEQFPLTTVEQRPTYDELKVNGVVTPDVTRSVPVLSLAGGRVVDIRAKLGDDVTKGQVLLRINSPEVAQAFDP
jgi:cobalt-zinc-cadmium efflux system membrane fusion protein